MIRRLMMSEKSEKKKEWKCNDAINENKIRRNITDAWSTKVPQYLNRYGLITN